MSSETVYPVDVCDSGIPYPICLRTCLRCSPWLWNASSPKDSSVLLPGTRTGQTGVPPQENSAQTSRIFEVPAAANQVGPQGVMCQGETAVLNMADV